MDLILDTKLSRDYKNPSQVARVITESWAQKNLYCPACNSNKLSKTANNTKAVDFICPICHSNYQLKSSKNKIGKKINDAAYDAMINSLKRDVAPHFFIMQYNSNSNLVYNLILIPSFGLPLSAIEARKPLSPKARRAGWVGCNILIGGIPNDSKILIINEGNIIDKNKVRYSFNKTKIFASLPVIKRGWTLDILNIVRLIDKSIFSLSEVYNYHSSLQTKYPGNKNIPAKIRQQLQILRDLGYIEFIDRGLYKLRDTN